MSPGSYRPPDTRAALTAALRIVRWQAMTGSVFAALVWLWRGAVPGYSAAAGVAVCVLPALLFAARLFAPQLLHTALPAAKIVRGAYLAEALKLAVTALLFALVFVFVEPLHAGFLFAGFVVTQAAVVWAALRETSREE